MNRRDFFKLSSLFAVAIAVGTNPILNAAAKLADIYPDNKVLLYLIKNRKNGKWYVKATKYTDIAKKRIMIRSWHTDTFRALEIVDHSEATEVRNKLWKLHIDRRPPNSAIDMVKATQGGLTGGPKTGALWAERYRNNDPMAIKNLQQRTEGLELWKQTCPEEWEEKMSKLHNGANMWMQDMQQNHPEEWKAKCTLLMGKYIEWCEANPELRSAASSVGGKASIKKRKQDPETFLNTVSAYGKKGMATLQAIYAADPELKAKDHKIACDAAAAKATETRLANIDKLHSILTVTFSRESIFALCKEHNIPANSAKQLMNDSTLSVKVGKINVGGGRGSSIAMWDKL